MYVLATSQYLRYLNAAPDPIIRAQGFLLLTLYALHMPSKENIITISSWTMRFCIMAQLHLVEAEPEPFDSDTLIKIQHRRRIFWCAYGIDRAVCSSYDYPYSIPDSHITVPVSSKPIFPTHSLAVCYTAAANNSRCLKMLMMTT